MEWGIGMIFTDRQDAGKQLLSTLKEYKDDNSCVVIGLPRGGVVVAYEIAQGLGLPLDIICPRKIGARENPEYAIGAVTETGDYLINKSALQYVHIDPEWLEQAIKEESAEAASRLKRYRLGLPKRNLKGKKVILVDDGIATGSTFKAALLTAKSEGAKEIIAAIPVAPVNSLEGLRTQADKVVCLYVPDYFQAIGEFYRSFFSTSDEEVIQLLQSNRSQ